MKTADDHHQFSPVNFNAGLCFAGREEMLNVYKEATQEDTGFSAR